MSGQKEKKKSRNAEKDCGFKSLCIFGGTFDPVHNGHIRLANFVQEELGVDKIIFVPSYLPPHKPENIYTSFRQRYEMLEIATRDNPDFIISTIEMEMQGVSYSYLTIEALRKRYFLKTEKPYFLIGGDSLVNFHQWRYPEKILESAHVVVVNRSGNDFNSVNSDILGKVKILNSPLINISSTEIRQRISTGQNCDYLVMQLVLDYIYENSLYKP
ncbi:MAG: nicotinate (nicotinamide) nucleotide adenylyltransferase [Candidatus Marinimicrobia bacterium]|nr:nicotinate (nicotinamide) nucleotide adenylyltransferase [Candidatus Neomarinimicrobiota bacterium]